jgi:hypothetical protein
MSQLRDGEINEFVLSNDEGSLEDFDRIVLAAIPRSRYPTVRIVRSNDGLKTVIFSGTSDDWDLRAELLSAFGDGKPGHQYLNDEPADQILVELSYLEKGVGH